MSIGLCAEMDIIITNSTNHSSYHITRQRTDTDTSTNTH